MSGRLIGIGVGPGAPDLLTLRAIRHIEAARHLAYITARAGESLARSIAADFIPDTAQELEILMPMRAEQSVRDHNYDEAAARMRPLLQAGKDVVFLCEGDPLFYGSFIYLLERLQGACAIEVVPGIASPMASAAIMQQPLSLRDETLMVLPATLPEAQLRDRLQLADTAIIMKLGRHMDKMRKLLEELGLTGNTAFIQKASMPGEQACALADAPETAPYFALLIVSKRRDAWT